MRAQDRIVKQIESLSPALQATARFVIDHPGEVVFNSMRALAEHAGLQPATLVRLAQQLGYSGWPELKKAFVSDYVLTTRGTYRSRGSPVSARDAEASLLSDVFAAVHRNLDDAEINNQSLIQKAVRLLRTGSTIHVAGLETAFPVAYFLATGLHAIGSKVQLISNEIRLLQMQVNQIYSRDVVMVIDCTPYSDTMTIVLNAARRSRARIVALTDSNVSPSALLAEVSLVASSRGASKIASVGTMITIAEGMVALHTQHYAKHSANVK